MIKRKAIIISLSGKTLSFGEKKLISLKKPWGVILFSRNISNFEKTKKLITSIKKAARDKSFPILIDEEGGKVSRLSAIIENNMYTQSFFGKIYELNKKNSLALYKLYIEKLSKILTNLGININTVPVLDITKNNTHKIILNRSFSKKIETIKSLGKFCIKTYKKNKIFNVIKHIPGHGSASLDSHLAMPIVNKNYKNLNENDFKCFKDMNSLFAMTAHVNYKKLDNNVATFSKKIINEIIRKKIGFKGILISDDISMKALKYDIFTNAKKSLEAGCNLALYCAGKYGESSKLLDEMPYIDNFTIKKTSEFYKFLR
jgi:beta-N-acetylhexosaminidase